MANRKVTMTHLRAIIREFKLGTPMREIERKLKISRTSLRPYKERAEASGKPWTNFSNGGRRSACNPQQGGCASQS